MRDRAARGLTLVLDENLSGHRIIDALASHGIPVKRKYDPPFVAKILADGKITMIELSPPKNA